MTLLTVLTATPAPMPVDQLPDGAAAGTPLLFVGLLVLAALSALSARALRKRRPDADAGDAQEP